MKGEILSYVAPQAPQLPACLYRAYQRSQPDPSKHPPFLGVGFPSILQGGISRFGVVRPITLRNLVLYNLAPGGMYPEGKPAAPMLSYRDAAWRRSALPLWFFQCAR